MIKENSRWPKSYKQYSEAETIEIRNIQTRIEILFSHKKV